MGNFEWIDAEDSEHSVVSFIRSSRAKRDKTIVVANFAAQNHEGYEIRVPSGGEYEVVLCTDSKRFGGNAEDVLSLEAKKKKGKDKGYYISVDLPELSAMYIKKKPKTKKLQSEKATGSVI